MMTTLTGQEFKEMFCKPIVYCWIRADEYLYVGKSYYGFQRITSKRHDTFKREDIKDTDTIEVYYFNDEEECLVFEQHLIKKHTPLYNFKPGRKLEGEGYRKDIMDFLRRNNG